MSTIPLNLKIQPELKARLDELAKRHYVSMSAIVKMALVKYIEESEEAYVPGNIYHDNEGHGVKVDDFINILEKSRG